MNRGLIFLLLVVFGAVVVGTILWPNIAQALTLISDPQAIAQMIRQSGAWGLSVLVILLILQVFIALIPGQALMIASGYLYGFWGGTLVTWLALVAGGQLAFGLARRFGRPLVSHFVPAKILSRWDQLAAYQGIGFFTAALVLPLFPNDAMCYIAGLGKISSKHFALANMLGRLIAAVALSFVGAYGPKLPIAVWVGLSVAIATGILTSVAIKNKWLLRLRARLDDTE